MENFFTARIEARTASRFSAIDPVKGTLTPVEFDSHSKGKTPRNFGIDPTGRYLIAANQDSNSLVVFPASIPKPAT